VNQAIAVFDVDGTLLRTSSAESIFVRYLMSSGELGAVDGARFLRHFAMTFRGSRRLASGGNRFYLKGKSVSRIEGLAADCFRERIAAEISDVAWRRMKEHKACGLETVLLSGTLDVLLRLLQQHLGADHAHGSTLAVSGGCYTGELLGIYPRGAEKAEIVRTHYGQGSYDLSASYAYADDVSDFELLRLFGHPAVVNPTRRLRAKAEREGIDTIFF
jgi:HAD superfamily hydrolase (TIGR01490 family)